MTGLLVLWGWLGAPAAHAACDAAAMTADIKAASPISVPQKFKDLAACDKGAASSVAAEAVPRMLPGEEATEAAVVALSVGALVPVQTWLGSLEPDRRSSTITALGQSCQSEPAVAKFFVDSHTTEQERFFKERWYRGLTDCRTPQIQALLTTAIDHDAAGIKTSDRAQFFGLLEVYARNLGAQAIPRIEELATEIDDGNEMSLVISAFADAANVGHVDGVDQAAAAAAVATIEKLGPRFPPDAIDQARATLIALGREDLATTFVKYRWPERMRDGKYYYGVKAQVIATCKGDRQQGWLHVARITDDGTMWPDQLREKLEASAKRAWKLDHAEKCKGTGTLEVDMSGEPVADKTTMVEWQAAQREKFEAATKGFYKVESFDEETIAF